MIETKKNALMALGAPIGYFIGGLLNNNIQWIDIMAAPVSYALGFCILCGADAVSYSLRKRIHGIDA